MCDRHRRSRGKLPDCHEIVRLSPRHRLTRIRWITRVFGAEIVAQALPFHVPTANRRRALGKTGSEFRYVTGAGPCDRRERAGETMIVCAVLVVKHPEREFTPTSTGGPHVLCFRLGIPIGSGSAMGRRDHLGLDAARTCAAEGSSVNERARCSLNSPLIEDYDFRKSEHQGVPRCSLSRVPTTAHLLHHLAAGRVR
jgi:hypothetical protein